jgi:hypothetical protein
MTFQLFWLDIYFKDRLFGFGFFGVTNFLDAPSRSFLSIYWSGGILSVDLCWFRILTCLPFLKRYLKETRND